MFVNYEKNLQIGGSTYSSPGTTAAGYHSQGKQSTDFLSALESQIVPGSNSTSILSYGSDVLSNFGNIVNLPPYSPFVALVQAPQYSYPVIPVITSFIPNFNYGVISPPVILSATNIFILQQSSNNKCFTKYRMQLARQQPSCGTSYGELNFALTIYKRTANMVGQQTSSGIKYVPILSKLLITIRSPGTAYVPILSKPSSDVSPGRPTI